MATYSSNTTIKWDSAVDASINNSGQTYTVPSGKIFRGMVITNNNTASNLTALTINGNANLFIMQGTSFELGAGATIYCTSGSSPRLIGNLYTNTP